MIQQFDTEYHKKKLPAGCDVELEMTSLVKRVRESYGDEGEKPWTPWTLVCEMFAKIPEVEGACLVIGDYNLLHYAVNYRKFTEVWFVPVAGWQKVMADKLSSKKENVKVLEVDYNDLIKSTKKELGAMKFDIIVGNPPYSGKTDIQYKILDICIKNSNSSGAFIGMIVPKNIYIRDSKRAKMYTSWLDSTYFMGDIECTAAFPTVAEEITAFVVDTGRSGTFKSISAAVPITFKAKRVVGIDYGQTSKIQSSEFPHPIYCCIGADGSPKYNRFTHDVGLSKLEAIIGSVVLHVNLHGRMIEFEKPCYVEQSTHGFFRQGIDSFIFSSYAEAQIAAAWINGSEGKKYIQDSLKGTWQPREAIRKLFKE